MIVLTKAQKARLARRKAARAHRDQLRSSTCCRDGPCALHAVTPWMVAPAVALAPPHFHALADKRGNLGQVRCRIVHEVA